MARVKFQIGDEVAVVDDRGQAWRIARIVGDQRGKGWRTDGTVNETRDWSKTGLSRDGRFPGGHIVHATEEHRRAIRLREWRAKLRREETWHVEAETIEAVARLLGWT